MGVVKVVVVELAPRHRQMVRLVPRAAGEQADETQTANVLDLLRGGRGDRQQFAIRQFGRLGAPSVMAIRHVRISRDHPLDGDQRTPRYP